MVGLLRELFTPLSRGGHAPHAPRSPFLLGHSSPLSTRKMIISILILLNVYFQPVLSQDGCSGFQAEYCNMRLDNILLLDSNVTTPAECQALCFKRDSCVKFSHFSSPDTRCVLFKQCSQPIKPCSDCISGPAYPRISSCQRQPLRNGQDEPGLNSLPENANKRPRCLSGTCFALCPTCFLPETNKNTGKEVGSKDSGNREDSEEMDPYGGDGGFSEHDEKNYDDDNNDDEGDDDDDDDEDDDDDDEVNVDDGLLDDVFGEFPETESKNKNNNRRNNNNNNNNNNNSKNDKRTNNGSGSKSNCPTCQPFNPGFYYCVMGGSNANGPVSAVSVLNTGSYAVPRAPLISPFPSFMTQGNGATFSTFTGRSLLTCVPGYPVQGFYPGQNFGQFFPQTYVPGTCNSYDFNRKSWTSTGGKLNSAREGGSTLRVGSYLVTLGGVSPSGYPVPSVEIFDSRRADKGWKQIPSWSNPSATRDQCTVMTRDPKHGPELMVIGGEGREESVMKMVLGTGQWFSLPGMLYPRKQHACAKVNMNGRPGVVVSGGSDGFHTNMTAVEFFDLNSGAWVNLPSLDRGRRGHVMTTVEGNLAVAGGTATGAQGDTEFLDDVEVFDGKRWKRANYRLDGARNGANLVKIPFSSFGSFTG